MDRIGCVSLWMFLSFGLIHDTAAASLSIDSGPYGSGKAYVWCNFDGIKERCVLDTGSAMTIVSGTNALRRYPNLGKFRFKSATGIPQSAETIYLRTIEIDGKRFPNVKIGRLSGVDGLESMVGIDLVGREDFSLNFRDKPSLILRPQKVFSAREPLEVDPHGLLCVAARLGEIETRALWDTGASLTTVDEGFIKQNPRNFERLRTQMKGIDGAGKSLVVTMYQAKRLTIGARTFRNLQVAAVDLSPLRGRTGRTIQAVIGFNVIRQADWYFDRKNRVWGMR